MLIFGGYVVRLGHFFNYHRTLNRFVSNLYAGTFDDVVR